MNSKERVLKALNHCPTDRVPVALCFGWWLPQVEQSLREFFYLRTASTLNSVFNFDFYWVEPVYRGPALTKAPDGHRLGIFGTPEYSDTYSQEFWRPLASATNIAEIENYPWPQIDWLDVSSVTHFARLYQEYAIVAPNNWSPIFCQMADLCGYETALANLITEPKLTEALIEKISDWNCARWEKVLNAAPGLIDIAYVGDDVASQIGMLFRPDLWRRYFKSAYARQFQIAKAKGVRVMFHICGACRDIVPDLIDIGLDILMPLQLSAKGMDPVELKREFGNHLTFWGGVDVQSFLPYASPDEVRQEVRRLVDILGKDGGYVLSSSHNFQPDTPIENIVAMYDEAARYYPY